MKNLKHSIKTIFLATGILMLTALKVSAQTDAEITTDQPVYVAGTTVTFNGSGFLSGEPVTIEVEHLELDGDTTVASTEPLEAIANENGEFVAEWLIPAEESQNEGDLVATARGLESDRAAQIQFSGNIKVDFRQSANNDAGYGPDAIHWINSILQQSNSTYREGMSALQRLVLANIEVTPDNMHTLQFGHQFSKGGHKAYDFLTGNSLNAPVGWNVAYENASGLSSVAVISAYQCQEELGPPADLALLCDQLHTSPTNFYDVELPNDPFPGVQQRIDAYEAIHGNRYMRIYGDYPIVNAYFETVVHSDDDLGDSYVNYNLVIETASTALIYELAGHLAISGPDNTGLNWGPDEGAGSINGGPYHFKLYGLGSTPIAGTYDLNDYVSLGAQDNQIKAGDIIPLTCECEIAGNAGPVCPGSSNNYCAPSSTVSSVWSISGNGSISGTGNCIDVIAGTSCGASYTLTLTSTNDQGCITECSITVMVEDTTAPVIASLPAPSTINCPATPVFAQATATDACDSNVDLTFNDVTTPGNCPGNYSVTRTWTATDDCGNSSNSSQTINVQDITAPVITCPATVQVNCAQNVPAPNTSLVSATDACDNSLTIVWVGDLISNQTCANRYTITRMYRATDDCGNSSDCTQLILVNDQNGPVMQCPMNVTVGCVADIPAPNVNLVTATDGCGGAPVITVDADVISNQTCVNRYTITRTYRATDVCGNVSTCSQTITVFDNTPPVITCPQNIVAGDCNTTDICTATATDNCTNVPAQITYNYACGNNFPVGNTVVQATAVDACGNTSSCNFTVTIVANPVCNLAIPAILPMAGSTGNTLCVAANSNYTYAWTVTGNGWSINSGATSNCITYTAGAAGPQATFCVTITNQYGCSTSCCVSFGSVSYQQCTYTQGFYGGNGKNCAGLKVINVINQALSAANGGNMVIGTPSSTRVLTILSSEGSCLNSKMPSGSSPAVLPTSNGNVTCSTANGNAYLQGGRFKGVLVGQTIALGLNIRNSYGLSSFVLEGNELTTNSTTTCSNGSPVAGSERTFCIPFNVWEYLSEPKTIGKLYTLANQALGGNTPSGMTISDINAAVDAINNGFDGCRILTSFGTCNATRAFEYADVEHPFESLEGRLELTSYPNPMGEEATMEFYSETDSKGTIEIYSSTGELVTTIFNGEMNAGETRSARFNAAGLANGIYIGKLSAGNRVKYVKIIISK